MKVYVLIANDKTINGIYSTQEKLLADLTTSLANVSIDKVEIWNVDKGFVDYLKLIKQTTITIEN